MSKNKKTPKQLEQHFKGVANHWRIRILLYIAEHEYVVLDAIVSQVGGNTKTISEHVHKLVRAGLVEKSYRGRSVAHTLTPHGHTLKNFILTFCRM